MTRCSSDTYPASFSCVCFHCSIDITKLQVQKREKRIEAFQLLVNERDDQVSKLEDERTSLQSEVPSLSASPFSSFWLHSVSFIYGCGIIKAGILCD